MRNPPPDKASGSMASCKRISTQVSMEDRTMTKVVLEEPAQKKRNREVSDLKEFIALHDEGQRCAQKLNELLLFLVRLCVFAEF